MTGQVEGLEELQANMTRIADRYGKEVAEAAQMGAQLVRGSAIKSIQQKSNGHDVTRYRLGGGSYQHTASAEGSAPNTDTGRLASSIAVETRSGSVFVGTTLEYGKYLEFGTRKMGPRPWLVPALELRRRDIEGLFRDAANPRNKV